jgi:hypothetical protein
VGKWREGELRDVQADLGITDGELELEGIMARTQPRLPSQPCLFHAPRDLYWALYRDGAQGGWPYWDERLRQELWKPSAEGMAGMDCLIAEAGAGFTRLLPILGTPKTSSLLSPG